MTIHLQREVDKLKKRLLTLSGLVEQMVFRTVKALTERDVALAQALIDFDVEIDQMEVDVEEECQKIFALYQPVAHDLRYIIAILKINTELERIGDEAVNIAEHALFLSVKETFTIPFDLQGMTHKTRAMLRKSLEALVNLDEKLAYEVIEADDEVDEINRQMYRQVESAIRETPEHLEALIHLLGVSRHLERIGDHASNIAEDVIYMINGKIVRHHTEEYLLERKKNG